MNEFNTIAIIEGDALIREILPRWFGDAPGFRCGNLYADVRTARGRLPAARPDLVLADLALPGAIECVRELKPLLPATRFVTWSVYEDAEWAFAALAAGAVGCLSKSLRRTDLIAALAAACRGVLPMTSAVARKVLLHFSCVLTERNRVMELNAHERTVLEFLARGYRCEEVSAALGVGVSIVEAHLRGVCAKLQARSQLGMSAPGNSASSADPLADKTRQTARGFLSIKGFGGSRTVTIAG